MAVEADADAPNRKDAPRPIAPTVDLPGTPEGALAPDDAAPAGKGRQRGQRLVADPRQRTDIPDQPAPRRRRLVSPLIRPILAINLLALVLLGGGLLYLDDYRKGLIQAEIENLRTQAIIVASALGEGAIDTAVIDPPALQPDISRQLVRRLVTTVNTRARLFGVGGEMIADTRILMGPGGVVQIRELAPPHSGNWFTRTMFDLYDLVVARLPARGDPPPYQELAFQSAADYDEARLALRGEIAALVRQADDRSLVISVAVPVQRYKQVLGALMLSRGGADIERAMRTVRFDIMRIFLVSLAVTVLLSLYLANTIARPVRRLAAAADRVRRGTGRAPEPIPDFTNRGDEIGELSASLRAMTDALWRRMDAIERFAADVAHEIKNPLTSLRSAVETVGRVTNPDHQRKLMQIIQDDVQRLDRLISDISDASRLDAELSRAESAPVEVDKMLATLVDVHSATQVNDDAPRLTLDVAKGGSLKVPGIESRLVQVFRNLLSNAASFSPPKGRIALKVLREGRFVVVTVEDEGPGIPEGKEAAIFDRFYTERPQGEKFGTHSGLGLSISKQIVDAHHGAIRAENRLDAEGEVKGARFIVKLPVD